MPAYTGSERRTIQRDWVGHMLQTGVILVAIGVPLAYWGSNVNATVATLAQRVERDERDITDERQQQTLVTGQLLDMKTTLTRIDTQIEGIRERLTTPKR